jgi:hypothetical protein
MLHWDEVKTADNPQGQTLMGDVWQDIHALTRFANLDSMKPPGSGFRDTMSVLADQLRALVPKRQAPCLPRTAAGFAHAIRRSEIFLLGTLSIRFTRSNGRSLIVLRRVD